MQWLIDLLNSNIFSSIIGILGVGFGVWQYKRATHLQKIVNDYVRGLYNDAKKTIEFAKKQDNYQIIAERGRAIKQNIIRLDIINRNLTKKKIEEFKNINKLTSEEAEEYKNLSSE